MDWAALLLDPIYSVQGVEATLSSNAITSSFTVTALDKTAGVVVGEGDGPGYQDIRLAAIVRMPELTAAGVTPAELHGGEITLNGNTWRIESSRPRPLPNGQAEGELMLILMKG